MDGLAARVVVGVVMDGLAARVVVGVVMDGLAARVVVGVAFDAASVSARSSRSAAATTASFSIG